MTDRDIDCLVAERVYGWKGIHDGVGEPPFPEGDVWGSEYHIPQYTENMLSAWKVLDTIKSKPISVRIHFIKILAEVVGLRLGLEGTDVNTNWLIFHLQPKDICLSAINASSLNYNGEGEIA